MDKTSLMQTGTLESGVVGLSPVDPSMSTTRMAYVADLLLELQAMASSEGHTTLAGLLALAHSEAITKTR